MVKITKEEIVKLARISQMRITDQEITSITNHLEAVLTYASSLKEIADKHDEYKMPKNVNVFREDEIIRTESEPILEQAPAREENYFVVPVILKNN